MQAPSALLSLGAPLWLPPRRPRALALAVHDDGDGRLERVHEALTSSLARAIDWRAERRRLRAHVTVARLGRGDGKGSGERSRGRRARGADDERQVTQPAMPPTPQLSFEALQVVLYRSWLSPQGASYEALASGALGPAGAQSPAEAEEASDGEPEGL